MGEKRPPIEPLDYLSGVKVVDIGDLRVARGMSRRPHSACKHHRLHYDKAERRVWCPDCETDVEPFDAFELLVENFHQASERLERREQEIRSAEEHSLISIAAKKIDKAWRSRTMVPACPHCKQGLFPEDFKNGIATSLGREYAEARRRARQDKEGRRE